MTLKKLGWSPFFEASFQELSSEDLVPARVFRQDKLSYRVAGEEREYTATLLGRLLYSENDTSQLPAVGDWVAIQSFDADQAVIHAVLPRISAFYRKEAGQLTRRQVIAANIDIAFLVSGLDHDFNVRRIERYLVQTAGSGAHPVIVLNKSDLCADLPAYLDEVRRIAPDTDLITLSAKEGKNLEALQAYIQEGKTVAFLGSSGVGKSSLVNRLLGEEQFLTSAVREDDSRGRHTTSHRELVVLPSGGLVIDTPGLRELQLWGEEEDLHVVFGDIEELAADCRFRDCEHSTEPGCAVKAALESGDLDEDRFESYLKLRRELAYFDRRHNEAAAIQAKKRERDFGKMAKEIQRHNPKR